MRTHRLLAAPYRACIRSAHFGVAACGLLFCAGVVARGGQAPHVPSTGAYKIYLILHQVGEERYELTTNSDGIRTLTTTFEYTDRTNKRTTNAKLTTTSDE